MPKGFEKEAPLLSERVRSRRKKRKESMVAQGYEIPLNIKAKIRKTLSAGEYSLGDIAKMYGVSRSVVYNIISKDSLLMQMYEDNYQRNIDLVEKSMFDRAINGEGMSGERAGEFVLRAHRRDTYGDDFNKRDLLKDLPKILVPLNVSRSPIDAKETDETIDV